MLPLWLAVLWLAAVYLTALGMAVFAVPAAAYRFLSSFAQTHAANWLEAGLRCFVGLAFVGAAPALRFPQVAYGIGAILVVTSLMLALVPRLHRRFARTVMPIISRALPFLGVGSLVLAALLVWLIL